jgi:hypothetical protein
MRAMTCLLFVATLCFFSSCGGGGSSSSGGGGNGTNPVNVSGTWKETTVVVEGAIEYEVSTWTLSQQGSTVTGSMQDLKGKDSEPISNGRVNGNSISFELVTGYYPSGGIKSMLYWGTVNGNVMTGKKRDNRSAEGWNELGWRANRQ